MSIFPSEIWYISSESSKFMNIHSFSSRQKKIYSCFKMAAHNGLSARCISLLEEVKGLIESQGSSPNVGNQIEIASGSNAGATGEASQAESVVGRHNSQTSGETGQLRATQVMQNFRSLFTPYASSSSFSANYSTRPHQRRSRRRVFFK